MIIFRSCWGISTLFLQLLASDSVATSKYIPPRPNPHLPLDKLPDARPPSHDRLFTSKLVEDELDRVSAEIKDEALRRIWQNAYPNTLDTTVSWHDADRQTPLGSAFPRTFLVTGDITASWLRDSTSQMNPYMHLLEGGPPGKSKKLDEEWDKLYRLALGLLYMQSQFVLTHPYANAFGPPKSANLSSRKTDFDDPNADYIYPPAPGFEGGIFSPKPNADYSLNIPNDGVTVFEAKWEVDSLANFFRLAATLAKSSGRADFVHNRTWRLAAQMALSALKSQQRDTKTEREALKQSRTSKTKTSYSFSKRGHSDHNQMYYHLGKEDSWWGKWVHFSGSSAVWRLPDRPEASPDSSLSSEWNRRFESLAGGLYRFRRQTRSASETKSEDGFGEPVKYTGMVKSAFRPSDDATILPFFVPGNAQLAAALSDLVKALDQATSDDEVRGIRDECQRMAEEVTKAIQMHAVVHRKDMDGDVYVYETDGYGSTYFMDDANIPSLLSLPYLGFVKADDPIYLRTRAMVLSDETDKYLLKGKAGWAIGGPHVGYGQGWPMSRSMQILTTTSREEQMDALRFLRSTTSGTGLIHESVDVDDPSHFSRSWFAWTNGLFGEAILHVLKTNPDLLKAQAY